MVVESVIADDTTSMQRSAGVSFFILFSHITKKHLCQKCFFISPNYLPANLLERPDFLPHPNQFDSEQTFHLKK